MIKRYIVVIFLFCSSGLFAQQYRWNLSANGKIDWTLGKHTAKHLDHVEMSGRLVSMIVTYGIDSLQHAVIHKSVVFPMLRTIPNDTRGSLHSDFEQSITPIMVNGSTITESPVLFSFNGILHMVSTAGEGVSIEHHIFPSFDKAAVIEQCVISNKGRQAVEISVANWDHKDTTDAAKGVYGAYVLESKLYGGGKASLLPGDTYTYSVVISGYKICEQSYYYSAGYEYLKRMDFLKELSHELVLKTPDDTLNSMFNFSKIRASESIYDTKNGLMHGPGGGSYYAAIWANDEAEYVNPFFPFLGNGAGIESAMNAFRLFAGYMNNAFNPIPSSITAEGTGFWAGAGDRGDQAMIAYGASRFALAYGDTAEAEKLWPLINWCFQYLEKKKTPEGVIASDADELEGRFPAGKVNLSTNVLAYGAMISAAHLAAALGKGETAQALKQRAEALKLAIDKYFGGKVQGFDTYRYYDGNTTLRSWIGLPLVMGIFDRKQETLKALYSPFLWTKDGMLTESGSTTYWDRALLYALRGSFYAGATDSTLKYLKYYSGKRLLGEHVPYAIEAWPEGDQRQLSAESGLYCRCITEGLFGLQPTGFNSFSISPYLPKGWDEMELEHVKAFNNDFTIHVLKNEKGGEKVIIKESNGKIKTYLFDGKTPVDITL